MDPILGQIIMFGGNFEIQGWAFCNGQLLSIAENSALFALLGTTYGGDGQNTFGLPDLRGRVPVHPGGPSNIQQGQVAGSENVTLTVNNLPAHSHNVTIAVNSNNGEESKPVTKLANSSNTYREDANANLGGVLQTPVGQNQPLPIKTPYLVINYLIALEGIFPSRN